VGSRDRRLRFPESPRRVIGVIALLGIYVRIWRPGRPYFRRTIGDDHERPIELGIVVASLIALIGPCLDASADTSVAEFYQGKTITILVGSSPGGGYDGDVRTVARHLAGHIPGVPNIIVQNMPGARGLAAANYLYNLAKRDGTVMGILEREHLIDSYLIPDGVRYDERNFSWIGSIGSEQGIAFAWHTAPQKTVEDIRKAEFIVGGYSNSAILPLVYNNTMGTRFKLIKGYTGSGTVLLAVEKGEVQGIGNYSLSNILAKHSDWIKNRKINILFQTGDRRDAALPDVPLASDFALNEEKRRILHLWLAPNAVARPLALPPKVPPDRLTAIRQAFMALFQDPVFLSDARNSGMSVDPQDGEFIENLVRELRALPRDTIEAAKAAAVGD
jgi:tripartite-type tricarboxylate transporter receptor subunit TctC